MSTLTPSKRVLSVALAVLLAAAAGAVGPAVAAPTDSDTVAQTDATVPADEESNLTAEEIVQRHSDRLESMETISMTVRMNTSADQYSSSSTSELWIDFEDKQMRTESSSDYANTTTVRNGTGTVTYDADRDVVRVPRVCLWFRGDFGGGTGIRRLLRSHGVVPEDATPSLRYRTWDWSKTPGKFVG